MRKVRGEEEEGKIDRIRIIFTSRNITTHKNRKISRGINEIVPTVKTINNNILENWISKIIIITIMETSVVTIHRFNKINIRGILDPDLGTISIF